ncbi:hypothetical protein AAI421_18385 [Rhodococcus aetherivorans]|uniref:hypothetical protein n=1 Tax=Rhodococcus aetherivorans TaxID=191292 RepID=UPI0031D4230C
MSDNTRIDEPTISFDGRSYMISELVDRVRELTPLTRDDVRAILREEVRKLHREIEVGQACTRTNLEPLLSDVGELLGAMEAVGDLLDGTSKLSDGLSKLLDVLAIRASLRSSSKVSGIAGVGSGVQVAHDSSPSVDGCGSPTVGDGQAAGAAESAPAADTDGGVA